MQSGQNRSSTQQIDLNSQIAAFSQHLEGLTQSQQKELSKLGVDLGGALKQIRLLQQSVARSASEADIEELEKSFSNLKNNFVTHEAQLASHEKRLVVLGSERRNTENLASRGLSC